MDMAQPLKNKFFKFLAEEATAEQFDLGGEDIALEVIIGQALHSFQIFVYMMFYFNIHADSNRFKNGF